jgi:hypothetical protein
MSETDPDDDFVDVLPAKLAGKLIPPLVVRVMRMRSAERVQFNFAPALLEEIVGPRYDIAWSQKRRLFRISARDLGRYEAVQSGRSKRLILRCPLPPLLHASEEVLDPEYYVDAGARVITVEIGDAFKQRALPAPSSPASPAPAARLPAGGMKDIVARAKAAVPAPDFSARPKGGGMAEMDDKVIRTALGLTEPRALELGEHRFPKSEAAVVELLAQRDQVTKQAIMMATADPIGEDERDDKIADVFICKVRPKLEALGFKVMTRWGESWTIAASDRRRLKAMIAEARAEAAA